MAVARAEQEPTLTEIAIALRETRRSAGRLAPFSVIDNHRGSDAARTAGEGRIPARPGPPAEASGPTGIAELRAEEIQRLLAENARLNDRITYLLSVIERKDGHVETATDRSGIASEVREALEAELRPVLLVLLRLLEKQQAGTAPGALAAAARQARGGVRQAEQPRVPATSLADGDGIIDLDAHLR